MLNELATKYRETNSQDDFNTLHGILISRWKPRWEREARSLQVSVEDLRALYEDKLLSLLTKSNVKNFEHMLNRSILNAKRDIIRELKKKRKNGFNVDLESELLTKTKDGEDFRETRLSQYADSKTIESEVFGEQRKRDKLQLISYLLAGEDELLCSIIDAFSHCKTVNAVSKYLGVHHTTVIRAIKRIRKKYDCNRELFEDPAYYLSA